MRREWASRHSRETKEWWWLRGGWGNEETSTATVRTESYLENSYIMRKRNWEGLCWPVVSVFSLFVRNTRWAWRSSSPPASSEIMSPMRCCHLLLLPLPRGSECCVPMPAMLAWIRMCSAWAYRWSAIVLVGTPYDNWAWTAPNMSLQAISHSCCSVVVHLYTKLFSIHTDVSSQDLCMCLHVGVHSRAEIHRFRMIFKMSTHIFIEIFEKFVIIWPFLRAWSACLLGRPVLLKEEVQINIFINKIHTTRKKKLIWKSDSVKRTLEVEGLEDYCAQTPSCWGMKSHKQSGQTVPIKFHRLDISMSQWKKKWLPSTRSRKRASALGLLFLSGWSSSARIRNAFLVSLMLAFWGIFMIS